MKIGDTVVCDNMELYGEILPLGKELKVESIHTNDAGDKYFLVLEGIGSHIFPEEDFHVVTDEGEVDPKIEIMDKLHYWRDQLIAYENIEDEGGIAKSKKYLDFYLDKLNLQKKYDQKAQHEL